MSKGAMRIDLDIELEGVGWRTAHIGLPEFVAVEREFGIAASELSGDSGRLEPMLFMAHTALKRQKVSGVPSAFDDFLAAVADIGGEDDDDEGDDE